MPIILYKNAFMAYYSPNYAGILGSALLQRDINLLHSLRSRKIVSNLMSQIAKLIHAY